jgi:tetratricopeptide (TPR) repeat protein
MQTAPARTIRTDHAFASADLESIGTQAAALHKQGRSAEAAQHIAAAVDREKDALRPDSRLTLLRAAVGYTQASHRPDLARNAAARLRIELDGRPSLDGELREVLTDALLLEAETAAVARDFPESITAATRAVELRREGAADKRGDAHARLIDALASLARHLLAAGDAAFADSSLAEAESLIPRKLPAGDAWRARAVMLSRIRASLEQGRNRHAEAIAAFETALRALPQPKGPAKRDLAATRVQMLVRLGRSRLALGQAESVASEAAECEALVGLLVGEVPHRAIETLRAAVLANEGAALVALGQYVEAERRFGSGLAILAAHTAPEMEDLRRQMVDGRLKALTALGRNLPSGDVTMVPQNKHGAGCGCGHDHDHDQPHPHDHGHDHRHHGHHHHGDNCSCGSH